LAVSRIRDLNGRGIFSFHAEYDQPKNDWLLLLLSEAAADRDCFTEFQVESVADDLRGTNLSVVSTLMPKWR
jgi:hypothetical protein